MSGPAKGMPAVGDTICVLLPGEKPWATVLEIDGERIRARIDNKLFREFSEHEKARWTKADFDTAKPLPELHGHACGDELWFAQHEFIPGYGEWCSVADLDFWTRDGELIEDREPPEGPYVA